MQTTEFIPDAEDIQILAFRLAWPGRASQAEHPPQSETRRRRSPAPAAGQGLARLIPAKIRARLLARRQALQGWPVTLSAPGPDTGRSWLPSVKLTGRPLD
jgi:hypothetical protein